jgi:3-phosphoshikimate 1-carboxyvinyltransferase
MADVTLRPARNVLGSLRLPGDKSISHRYAMLAALVAGTSRLGNFSSGADCASTLACMEALGAQVRRDGRTVEITGRGPRLLAPRGALDCGNSGSTMRMLSGILAGQPFVSELVGDESLSRRPMARIMEPLGKMGARMESREGNRPPLRVFGAGANGAGASSKLRGITYAPPVPSAQVKSCLLFAGLLAEGETSIEEPFRTRDHGELALRAFGAELKREGERVAITGGQRLRAIEAVVPGDISSAAFFLCAAAIFPGSNLVIEGLGLNPTRAALLDVLAGLGARISMLEVSEASEELTGTVKIEHNQLHGLRLDGALASQLIDELPVLAAIAPFTAGGAEIRDARELRVKESDRIALVARNLRAMGAEVAEHDDGLSVPGGQRLHGAEIESGGDHRIAMAFSVAALGAEGASVIHGAEAARISFPEFFEMLEAVVER